MIIKREKKDKVRFGIVGCGRRGLGMSKLLCEIGEALGDVELTAICDVNLQATEKILNNLEENGLSKPSIVTDDYMELVNNPNIDAIWFLNDWTGRAEMAIKSMEAGKYTGIEVGCAFDLSECYALIDTYERTGSPLMMLENANYDRKEMVSLNLFELGLLGEIVHCDAGYHHYLTEGELFLDNDGEKVPHYRIYQYIHRNCHSYPTHDFGPMSKLLKINRGNRVVTINSIASKSRGLKDYAVRHMPEGSYFANVDYKQGDIVTTVLTCANGETVHLCLDTTLPRGLQSENFTVRGTRGMMDQDAKTVYFEGMDWHTTNNEEEMFEKYDHPLYKEYRAMGTRGGHGGCDWLMARAFIEAVKNGTNTPIDAYDTVTWMAIGVLSEMSIAKSGAPVDFPDFTRGKWINREPIVEGKYCLDKVCVDENVKIY